MKFFSSSLLALLFTSAMANVINNPTINFASLALGSHRNSLIENNTRFLTLPTNNTFIEEGEECQKVISEKYTTCIEKVNEALNKITNDTNIDLACPTFEEANCQALIKEDIILPADCNQATDYLRIILELDRYVYYTGCAKDEQGQFCPSSKVLTGKEELTDAQIKEQSCPSEKCATTLEEINKLKLSLTSTFNKVGVQNFTLPYDTAFLENIKCEEKKSSSATTKVLGFPVLSLALSLYAVMMVLF